MYICVLEHIFLFNSILANGIILQSKRKEEKNNFIPIIIIFSFHLFIFPHSYYFYFYF